jgi:hypothetical protein
MFLILQLGVYEYTKDLNTILRRDSLSLDSKGFYSALVIFAGKVYNYYLLYFKRRPTSSLLVKRLVDNSFNTFLVTLRYRSYNPRSEVIAKRDRSPITVNSSLY